MKTTFVRDLRGPVPEHFERFYRAQLRWCSGARIRTREVKRRYDAWAQQAGGPAMHERHIKRAMVNVGHSHFRSNHCFFGHAQLAAAVPGLPDNFPEGPPPPPSEVGLVGRIDRIALELEQLRRDVVRTRPR